MPEAGPPSAIDLSGLDPAELAEAVGGMPDEQLQEVMISDLRAAALDEVFSRFPDFVDPARTRDARAAIEWVIAGPGRGTDRFMVLLDRGACRAGRELDAHPDLTLELDAVDFLRLVTGRLVHIDDGSCRAERDGDGDARATISMDGADFLKLVTGNANPTMSFLKGKLRVQGDLMFAAHPAGMFKIPGADE